MGDGPSDIPYEVGPISLSGPAGRPIFRSRHRNIGASRGATPVRLRFDSTTAEGAIGPHSNESKSGIRSHSMSARAGSALIQSVEDRDPLSFNELESGSTSILWVQERDRPPFNELKSGSTSILWVQERDRLSFNESKSGIGPHSIGSDEQWILADKLRRRDSHPGASPGIARRDVLSVNDGRDFTSVN